MRFIIYVNGKDIKLGFVRYISVTTSTKLNEIQLTNQSIIIETVWSIKKGVFKLLISKNIARKSFSTSSQDLIFTFYFKIIIYFSENLFTLVEISFTNI